ncbi:MAG: hypothetical protein RR565_10265 [Erysipelothrix sp.]
MEKIIINDKIELELNNVIAHQLNDMIVDKLDWEIHNFENKISLSEITCMGPIIVKSSGTKINEVGEIRVDYEILVEIEEVENIPDYFSYYEEYHVKDCVQVIFDDSPEYLGMASQKMNVYFYEMNYEDNGELFTIISNYSEENCRIEYFKPIAKI